jgi:hypothetical protein
MKRTAIAIILGALILLPITPIVAMVVVIWWGLR